MSTGKAIKHLQIPLVDSTSGFDFTLHMQRICFDICSRLTELQHVDISRVAIGFSQTRKAVKHGIQATLTPLRFQDGLLTTSRRGRRFTVQRVYNSSGLEMLYILKFYLPRFLNGPLEEKLTTILHELWHISPQFDGDLRRHPGRCYAHSASQQQYDAEMLLLAKKWLALKPPLELYGFLLCSFAQLYQEHGGVWGIKIPAPKLFPIST